MHFLHLPNWFFLQDEHWRRIEKKRIQYFFTYHHPPSLSNLNQFEVQVSPIIAFSQTVVFSNFSINEKMCMVKPKVFSDGACTADNHNFIFFFLHIFVNQTIQLSIRFYRKLFRLLIMIKFILHENDIFIRNWSCETLFITSVRPIYWSNRLISIGQLIGSANQTNPNIGSVSDRPIIRACIGWSVV